MEIKVKVEESIKKTVSSSPTQSSGKVYVPKEWSGREVIVALLPKGAETPIKAEADYDEDDQD